MISAVVPGWLSYRIPGCQEQFAAVSAGLAKVEDNEVQVLVDTAERPEDMMMRFTALAEGICSKIAGKAFSLLKSVGLEEDNSDFDCIFAALP